ncbi:hypothetical protein [Aequorivita nionensis]|uniref:hypothetical protein n=1 Tax=Flavobacteriaceae TaxID=49546 RepID=UPI003965A139
MNNIIQFVNTHPRNRLIIVPKDFIDVPYIDIGKSLSIKLRGVPEESLPNNAVKFLDEIVDLNLQYSVEFGNYIAIENIGILLEKDLKIDIKNTLQKYSRDTALIVKWEGEIEESKLYFLSKEQGVEINLKDITHIIL